MHEERQRVRTEAMIRNSKSTNREQTKRLVVRAQISLFQPSTNEFHWHLHIVLLSVNWSMWEPTTRDHWWLSCGASSSCISTHEAARHCQKIRWKSSNSKQVSEHRGAESCTQIVSRMLMLYRSFMLVFDIVCVCVGHLQHRFVGRCCRRFGSRSWMFLRCVPAAWLCLMRHRTRKRSVPTTANSTTMFVQLIKRFNASMHRLADSIHIEKFSQIQMYFNTPKILQNLHQTRSHTISTVVGIKS